MCTEAGMFALRERRIHVTQEDFEMAVGKVYFLNFNQKSGCEIRSTNFTFATSGYAKGFRKEHVD